MSDRPILFKPEMVQAILDGRKTQTRRVLHKQDWPQDIVRRFPHQQSDVPCRVGDRLWVREKHALLPAGVDYATSGAAHDGAGGKIRWRPGIHLPRVHSRLTLFVSEVRVQRLQEISREDAIAEGLIALGIDHGVEVFTHPWARAMRGTAVSAFADLWRCVNGPEAWDMNPWVAAITFRAVHRNIDAAEVA